MSTKEIGYAERAAFCDVEYTDTADHQLLAALLTEGVRSVLEIPCDVGRNTLFLARALARTGARLVAVDREPAMVARVAERLAERGDGANVEARVGDLLDLDLGERFELILVPRESFQLLTEREDVAQALRSLGRHLAPGGALVIDLATFAPGDGEDAAIAPTYFDPGFPDGVPKEEWSRALPSGQTASRTRVQRRIGEDRILLSYRYDVHTPGSDPETWTMDVPMAVHSKDGFTALARAAGLNPRAVLRDYQQRPWSPGAQRMIFVLEPASPAPPARAGEDGEGDEIVGWIKGDREAFVNERDARALTDFTETPLRRDRLEYFRAFFKAHYHDAFLPGMGTERALAALRDVGAAGRWLDLGAGTTTLFWSIPLQGITSVTCADIVVEALAVLHDFVRSSAVPGCYADVLAMFGKSAADLAETRRRFGKYRVFDALARWPSPLEGERFDLITAFGCFGMAASAADYLACFGFAAAHLAPGGRLLGADWTRRPEYIARDGHDNAYLDPALVRRAAEAAGLRLITCERAPIAGDPCYDGLLVWTLGAA